MIKKKKFSKKEYEKKYDEIRDKFFFYNQFFEEFSKIQNYQILKFRMYPIKDIIHTISSGTFHYLSRGLQFYMNNNYDNSKVISSFYSKKLTELDPLITKS